MKRYQKIIYLITTISGFILGWIPLIFLKYLITNFNIIVIPIIEIIAYFLMRLGAEGYIQ